jgi:hypothetical protein
VFKIRAEERTQDQRLAAIYYDLKSMVSAAHHDDDTTDGFTWNQAAGFTWNRAAADAILAATAGLLTRYTAA